MSILIVDDDPDDRFLTERMLEAAGFPRPFVAVDSVTAAMERIGEHPDLFHLVFVDIKMPVMDGFELLRWIRSQQQCEHVKVVMLTNSDEASDLRRARELGADGYLLKSHTAEKCAAILGGILPHYTRN